MEWIRNISLKIDKENHSLMNKYSHLKEIFRMETIEKFKIKTELKALKNKKLKMLSEISLIENNNNLMKDDSKTLPSIKKSIFQSLKEKENMKEKWTKRGKIISKVPKIKNKNLLTKNHHEVDNNGDLSVVSDKSILKLIHVKSDSKPKKKFIKIDNSVDDIKLEKNITCDNINNHQIKQEKYKIEQLEKQISKIQKMKNDEKLFYQVISEICQKNLKKKNYNIKIPLSEEDLYNYLLVILDKEDIIQEILFSIIGNQYFIDNIKKFNLE